ncbi:hypothetical protein RB195_025053 [Necator americanus]|uniref:Rho-GAP domain-containing protein n=1 Tax=Necator americanus TaxID=51031 RepID=A0ABR1EQQ0_NECAM
MLGERCILREWTSEFYSSETTPTPLPLHWTPYLGPRAKFDSGSEPDLLEFGQRDIHSVSSLLKQYFRQLPNPLFTFQSYSKILAEVCLP